MSDPIVIVAAARTPIGGFQGALARRRAASSAAPRSPRPWPAPASQPTRSTSC